MTLQITSRYIPERSGNRDSNQYLGMNVHNSTVHNSQDNVHKGGMGIQNVVNPYNRVLFNHKR